MNRSSRLIFLTIVLLLVAGTMQSTAAQANRASQQSDTLQELLEEVRMLRQALQTLQRMSVDTYRSQLLVDRIRVGHEDIRRLTDALNNARDTLAKTQSTIPQFVERQKFLENQAQSEVDQNKRAELEFELRRTKDAVEMYKSQIEPMKEREQQLTTELNVTKARIEELENRLDLLERAIDSDRQKITNPNTSTKNP